MLSLLLLTFVLFLRSHSFSYNSMHTGAAAVTLFLILCTLYLTHKHTLYYMQILHHSGNLCVWKSSIKSDIFFLFLAWASSSHLFLLNCITIHSWLIIIVAVIIIVVVDIESTSTSISIIIIVVAVLFFVCSRSCFVIVFNFYYNFNYFFVFS